MVEQLETSLKTPHPAFVIPHLRRLREMGDAGNVDTSDEGYHVRVATIHRAKNEEFDYIFLMAATEDRIPGTFKRDSKLEIPVELLGGEDPHETTRVSHIAEERKLVFLAMTRARHSFFFTSASANTSWANRPSRFIAEALGKPSTSFSPHLGERERDESTEESRTGQDLLEIHSLPFALEVHRPLKRLTFEHLNIHSICPLQYCYHFALNIPQTTSTSEMEGKIFGETFSDVFQKETPSLETLQGTLRSKWTEQFGDEEKESLEKYLSLMSVAYPQVTRPGQEVSLSEPFQFEVEGISIEGVFDRVDDDKNVFQFLSSMEKGQHKVAKSRRKGQPNAELLFHAWAFANSKQKKPESMTQLVLEASSGILQPAIQFNPKEEHIAQTKENVTNAIKSILAGVFQGTPSWKACSSCSYRHSCPVAYKKIKTSSEK